MSTKPPSGTRDFLPDEIRRREYVIGVVRDVYERYGFEPLETPAFENIETLLGKYGEEGNKLIFKILRRGEHEATRRDGSRAALRPDGPARAGRRAVPERAAAVLQALPDSAGLARRPARAGTVPRVLSVRHRRDRHDVEPRRGRAAGGGERRARAAGLQRFHDPAEPSRGAGGLLKPGGPGRSKATRWWRSTSWTRSATRASWRSSSREGSTGVCGQRNL